VLTDTRVSQSLVAWTGTLRSRHCLHPRAYNLFEEADLSTLKQTSWIVRPASRDAFCVMAATTRAVYRARNVCSWHRRLPGLRLDHTTCAALVSFVKLCLAWEHVRAGSSSSAFCKRNRHDACIDICCFGKTACAVVSLFDQVQTAYQRAPYAQQIHT
jgi:hypothetical protein